MIEDIKARWSIRDMCGRLGIQVLRNGMCRAPWRAEKVPSMKIYERTNTFYDFGSNRGGDVITLYADYYNISNADAVKDLGGAEYARSAPAVVMPPKTDADDVQACMSEAEKERYYEIWGMFDDEHAALLEARKVRINNNTEIFEALYKYCKMDQCTGAVRYLRGRGISEELQERFRIFTINNYWKVSNWLLKEFEPGDLARSGLVSDKGRLIFGSHRIMLPYLFKGAITYLRGRYFDREEKTSGDFSKYLGLKNDALGVNTAKRLFNVDVLDTMMPGEKLFVTEGEFDAIVLSKNANVVAVPGVGNLPAEGIMRRLNRFSVVVIPDNDIAGERLIEAIREHVPGARVKRLPDGVKDYTELILN